MAKGKLTHDAVVEHAADLLEQEGLDRLSLAALAKSLKIQTPSLYKHIDGLPGLHRALRTRAKRNLVKELTRATIGKSGSHAISSLATAIRLWALENPMQYPLTVQAPDPEDSAEVEVSQEALDIIYAVLETFALSAEEKVHATRYLRAVIHGFLSLETSQAFKLPTDILDSYDLAIGNLITTLENWPE